MRKSESFSTFDAREYLKTEEDFANYLRACEDEAGNDLDFMNKVYADITRARLLQRERALHDEVQCKICRERELRAETMILNTALRRVNWIRDGVPVKVLGFDLAQTTIS